MLCFVTVAKVHSFDDPDPVHGLAILDKKLYVLRKRPSDQIYVYDTKDYKLQHHITVPGLQPFKYNDLTECHECCKDNCLFLSDFGGGCIHKIEPKGAESKVSKFADVHQPTGLSMTPEGHLLVASNPNKLTEYNVKTGEKVCEVELQLGIRWPLHAVKREDGQYVVSQTDETMSRVCRVGADGFFRHCFGGTKGTGEDQLNYACHLALRGNDDVIVADNDNNRVVQLNGSLEYQDTLVEKFREPHRLWYDSHSRLLYVGESTDNGSITVYDIKK